jgi:hypothetical protein
MQRERRCAAREEGPRLYGPRNPHAIVGREGSDGSRRRLACGHMPATQGSCFLLRPHRSRIYAQTVRRHTLCFGCDTGSGRHSEGTGPSPCVEAQVHHDAAWRPHDGLQGRGIARPCRHLAGTDLCAAVCRCAHCACVASLSRLLRNKYVTCSQDRRRILFFGRGAGLGRHSEGTSPSPGAEAQVHHDAAWRPHDGLQGRGIVRPCRHLAGTDLCAAVCRCALCACAASLSRLLRNKYRICSQDRLVRTGPSLVRTGDAGPYVMASGGMGGRLAALPLCYLIWQRCGAAPPSG